MLSELSMRAPKAGQILRSVGLPLVLLLVVIGGVGSYAYVTARQAVTRSVKNDLEAVARLKVGQIQQWLTGRSDDARLIMTRKLSADLDAWLRGGMRDARLRQDLLDQLLFPETIPYRTLSVHAVADGRQILTAGDHVASPVDERLAIQAARLGQPVLADFHTDVGPNGAKVEVGLFVPIRSADRQRIIAVLNLSLDPQELFYPLLQTWPTASMSAETLLVRRDSDDVLYLNTLRHHSGAPLTLRRPLASEGLIAARLIKGEAGFCDCLDYREIPCLTYGLPVAGTPWFLVAKVDRTEAYGRLNDVAAFSAFLLAAFLSVFIWWLISRMRAALLLNESLQEIEDLYQHAPCGYHSLDANGVFSRINDTELKLLGYSRDEVVGKMKFPDLLTSDSLVRFHVSFPQFKMTGQARELEFELIRKDGSILPVQINAIAVVDADGRFLASRTMVNDISERKRVELMQQRHARALRLLGDCNMLVACSTHEQSLLDAVCKLIVETGDYLMAWIGVAEHDAAKTIRPVTNFGRELGFLDAVRFSWENSALGNGPTGSAVRDRIPQVNQDFRNNPAMAPWRDAALARGYQASIALPLVSQDNLLGVLTIYAPIPNAFVGEEVSLLQELANNLATGMAALRSRAAHLEATHSLQQSEERLRGLFGSIRDALFVLELDAAGRPGRLVDVNEVACQRLGYSRAELLTMRVEDINAPEFHADISATTAKLARDGYALFERVHVARDGRHIPVELSASLFTMHRRQMIVSLARDISERKETENNLRLLWQAVQSSFNAFLITEISDGSNPPSYPITYVNPAFEQITGYAASEVIGRSPGFLHGDDGEQEALLTLRQAMREERECRVVLRNYRKDGSLFWNEMLVSPVRAADGKATHFVGIVSDVTERRNASRERIESARQLQKLSAHLQSAREDERAHIARELHDELGQMLTALKMDISWLLAQTAAEGDPPEVLPKLQDMTALVDATLASVRRISSDLRPIILDDLGLKAAIEWLAEEFGKRYPQISCTVALELDDHPVDGDHAIAAYRIVQECMTNVVRHAKAGKIHIMAGVRNGDTLIISIQDNGRGLPTQPKKNGFGLLGMRERVHALGGSFSLESIPGEGVSVDVSIPLAPSAYQI